MRESLHYNNFNFLIFCTFTPLQASGPHNVQFYLTANEPMEKREGLRTGDFYLTKHSNLCETHVVFHLVTDEQLDVNGNMR